LFFIIKNDKTESVLSRIDVKNLSGYFDVKIPAVILRFLYGSREENSLIGSGYDDIGLDER